MGIFYLNSLDVKTIADCPLIEEISYFYVCITLVREVEMHIIILYNVYT